MKKTCLNSIKIYKSIFCICVLITNTTFFSQGLSGTWTGSGTNWTSTACAVEINTSVSNLQNGASVSFTPTNMGCNMPNTFSSSAIVNHVALAPFLDYGNYGKGVLTFTFSSPVTNPILHLDRLGGGYGFGPHSNSALLTLLNSGLTLTKLSENGSHLEVTLNTITRTPDQLFGSTTSSDCGEPTVGSAAGSIRINGTLTSVSFEFELNGADGFADAIVVIWELPNEMPNAGLDTTYIFCKDGVPEDLLSLLEGNPIGGGNWSPPLSSGNGIFNPQIDSAGVYTYTLNSGNCTAQSNLTVLFSEKPIITNVVVTDFSENNSIEIQVIGIGNYEYSLDGVNFQSSNFFNNLAPGAYTIVVKDINGCGLATTEAYILNYPLFFTPNNDGYNDFWNIMGYNKTSYTVYIYDRYGKLLKILNNKTGGWDGKYNGRNMPSTDYWFKFVDVNNRVIDGHFSLKR
jgi:gliding motility-associated-like protein